MKIYEKVVILWVDSQTISLDVGNILISELIELKPVPTETIGFLISENNECYILVNTLWETRQEVKYIHLIPKCCVKKIKYLDERRKIRRQ